MRLLLNQIKKDLRQTWPLWAAWGILVLLQAALPAWRVKPGDAAMQAVFTQANTILPWLNSLLILVLVPALVLQDPAVGTTPFWLTRPLRPGQVACGKALLAALVLALSVATQSALLLAQGMSAPVIGLAAAETALRQGAWIAIVGALAALMPSWARFAIAGALLYALTLFWEKIFLWISLLRKPSFPLLEPSLANSRLVVALATAIVGGAAVFLHQYLTRRTRRSAVLAVILGTLGLLAHQGWPVDFLKRPVTYAAAPDLRPDALRLEPEPGYSIQNMPDFRGGTPQKIAYAILAYRGLPARYTMEVVDHSGTVTYPDGEKLPLSNHQGNISFSPAFYRGQEEAIEEALGGVPLVNTYGFIQSKRPLPLSPLFILDSESYSRHLASAGDLALSLDLRAFAYRIAAEVPLKRGERFSSPCARYVVSAVLPQADEVDVILQETSTQLLLDPRTSESAYRPRQDSDLYILLNRKRGQALLQQVDGGWAPVGPSLLSTKPINLTFGNERRALRPSKLLDPLDAAWLADAVLVRLEKTPVADLHNHVDMPGFFLDGKSWPSFPSRRMSDFNPASVASLALPEHPTRPETWRYIRAVLKDSGTALSNDPQRGLLDKVGPENVDLLLIAINLNSQPNIVAQAIDDLAGEADKARILRMLPEQWTLISTVLSHGWQADAAPALIDALRANRPYLSSDWVAAVASLRDPATYNLLAAYAVANPTPQVIDALKPLPPEGTQRVVAALWRQHRNDLRDIWILDYAARWGIQDALDRAIEILAQPDAEDWQKNEARLVLARYSQAPDTTDAERTAWYQAHRGALAFDPALRRFVPADGTPADQEKSWADPVEQMKALGQKAAGGDLAAVDALAAQHEKLYAGIDYYRDREKVRQNAQRMRAAFEILGKAAGTDPQAYRALQYAQGKPSLRPFTAQAYGQAAAGGNAEALRALLHYQESGWTLRQVLPALKESAAKNDPQTVTLLVQLMNDPAARQYRGSAASGLAEAAKQGNAEAKAALDAYGKDPAAAGL